MTPPPSVNGPLFSFRAHGQLARTLQYQDGPHGATVRKAQGANASNTPAQAAQRARYHTAVLSWSNANVTDRDREAWGTLALFERSRLSGWSTLVRNVLVQEGAGTPWLTLANLRPTLFGGGNGRMALYRPDTGHPPTAHFGRTLACDEFTLVLSDEAPGEYRKDWAPIAQGTTWYCWAERTNAAGDLGRTGIISWFQP